MRHHFKVSKSPTSRLHTVDFNNIAFGKIFSDHMFSADYIDGEWKNFEILPYGQISFEPSMLALHYGQSVFEGMKAFKNQDGQVVLFRPEMHAKRLNKSASRLCMPELPEDIFLQAIHELMEIDQAWIPPQEGSALYIRPFMFATDELLGVKASANYRFIIFSGPVGPYYPTPIRLLAETKYVRAVDGGVGEAKAAGNYAASLLPAQLAKEKGYNQVMWMDAHEFKYVQEVGTMNLFFVIDGKVITPATDGVILKGITRDSIIHLLKARDITVEERKVSMDEIVNAYDNGILTEVFGSGTAAVIAFVTELTYKDKVMKLPKINEKMLAPGIKDQLEGMRSGRLPDHFNWLVPVKKSVSVLG